METTPFFREKKRRVATKFNNNKKYRAFKILNERQFYLLHIKGIKISMSSLTLLIYNTIVELLLSLYALGVVSKTLPTLKNPFLIQL